MPASRSSTVIVCSVTARTAALSPCSRARARAPAFFPGPRRLFELRVALDQPFVLTAQLLELTSFRIGLGTTLAIERRFPAAITLLAPQSDVRTVNAMMPQNGAASLRRLSLLRTRRGSAASSRPESAGVWAARRAEPWWISRHGEIPFSALCTLNYEGEVVSSKLTQGSRRAQILSAAAAIAATPKGSAAVHFKGVAGEGDDTGG